MGKSKTPSPWQIAVAMALFEQMLENFSQVDQDDMDHANAARIVLAWLKDLPWRPHGI